MIKRLTIMVSLFLICQPAWALSARIATAEDVALLKEDLLSGKAQVGVTRLKTIRNVYGDPTSITDSESKLVYDYGDLRLEFDKYKYFRKWEYDYSRKYAAKDQIDDLRYDLEAKQLIGNYVSYDTFLKDYDTPTEAYPTKGDGEHSLYYWGELKIMFENFIVLKSWRGRNLAEEKAPSPAGLE